MAHEWTIPCASGPLQANLMAPKLVPARLKGRAAGMMAIAYQTAHFVGLTLATLLAVLLYGDIF